MRIAILGSRGIPASYGGFETFAEAISTRLVAAGHEVTVYCEKRKGQPKPNQHVGVKLVYKNANRLGPLSPIIYDALCLAHARKGYDVVYMLGYASSWFCWIPKLFRTKVWVNTDGVEWSRAKYSPLAKAYLRFSERVAVKVAHELVFDAQGIENYFRQKYPGLPPYHVIPYGADVTQGFENHPILDNWSLQPDGYYLMVCRMVPENHVLEIIQGFVASDTQRQLIVVAHDLLDPKYVNACKMAANTRVRFMGTEYDPAAIGKLRADAYAYFHGHSVGGTNPTLVESMAYGSVILAHDNVFNREVTGNQCWYFSDSTALVKCISEIEQLSSEERQQRKEALQKRASEVYSWERVTQMYIDAFESIQTRSPTPENSR